MFYTALKFFIQSALQLFCKGIVVNNHQLLYKKGPLLITANHPNSFLDAIIIGSLFKHPVHFLARGDAFNTAFKRKLLHQFNMIPIYRLSEGKENLHLNEYAFTTSKAILKTGGIVLIFIEGICKNTHELQTFKKGAARIAINSWKENIPLQILPLTIRYDAINKFSKQVLVNIANPISKQALMLNYDEAKNFLHFNHQLYQQISLLLHQQNVKKAKPNSIIYILGIIGFLLHAPLYYCLKTIAKYKTKGTVFYDSVLFSLLLFFYPIFLLLFFYLLVCCSLNVFIAAFTCCSLPILARCAVISKK